MSDDILYRFLIPSLDIRAYAAITLDTARDICRVHNTTPNATAGLGKAVTAAVLLSSSLKPGSPQSLGYKIQGSGPLKEIQVQVDAAGNVRGYTVNPRIDETTDLGKISFAKAIGAGLLTVTKDLGTGEPHTSVSHLVKGEIAIDTAYYLTVSEQIPSAVVLALTLDHDGIIESSGGLLFQNFPGTPKESIEKIERGIASVTKPLGDHLKEGGDILTYISEITGGAAIDILSTTPIRHRCRCSKQLISSILRTLSRDDMEKMLKEDKGANVTCTFCNSEHRFSEEDLAALLADMK